MNLKKGVVLKLLYQIKMKLEKKGVNIDALTMKNCKVFYLKSYQNK